MIKFKKFKRFEYFCRHYKTYINVGRSTFAHSYIYLERFKENKNRRRSHVENSFETQRIETGLQLIKEERKNEKCTRDKTESFLILVIPLLTPV